MPGTPREMAALAEAWPQDSLIPPPGHRWADGTGISPEEEADLLALRYYLVRLRRAGRHRAGQRKARRLLRSLLAPAQRAELRRLRYFYVTTPGGNVYRLDPRNGHAERVERHGGRYFARVSYCLHDADDGDKMPPADVTIAHLLLLIADEDAFLATANASPRDDQIWNREYLRMLRDRRIRGNEREREAIAFLATAIAFLATAGD
jgi:hypothetical protein